MGTKGTLPYATVADRDRQETDSRVSRSRARIGATVEGGLLGSDGMAGLAVYLGGPTRWR